MELEMVGPTPHAARGHSLRGQVFEGPACAVSLALVAWEGSGGEEHRIAKQCEAVPRGLLQDLPALLLAFQQCQHHPAIRDEVLGDGGKEVGQQEAVQLEVLGAQVGMIPSNDIPHLIAKGRLQVPSVHRKAHLNTQGREARKYANTFRILLGQLAMCFVATRSDPGLLAQLARQVQILGHARKLFCEKLFHGPLLL